MTKVRTRFSPSPTGMIHLGNARTALFCVLYAKKHEGVFILRIEDTDSARSEERYVDALLEDLTWLGLKWQEGPTVDGPYGPYWESQRQSIYAKYYAILLEKKLMYPCFCSDQELLLARKLQLSRGQPPRYAGTCRKLSDEEINKRVAAGKKPAWRFIVPKNKAIEFVDAVKGPQKFNSDDMGDFIIRRADGTSPFLFCNAIDDATMLVSHVLRGEDHLANTPRQILILETLQLHIPQYGHIALIVGDDGAPLSKRHGSFSLEALRREGYLPEAINNYLARLGHSFDDAALLDLSHLAHHFSLEKLSRSPARFDKTQLLFWQKQAIMALDKQTLLRWLGENILNQVPLSHYDEFAELIRNNIEFPHDALYWAKSLFHEKITFGEAEMNILRGSGEQFFVEAEMAVDLYQTDISAIAVEMQKKLNVSGKKLYLPIRIALTGKPHGPELQAIAKLLGVEKLKHRFGQAFKIASGKTE